MKKLDLIDKIEKNARVFPKGGISGKKFVNGIAEAGKAGYGHLQSAMNHLGAAATDGNGNKIYTAGNRIGNAARGAYNKVIGNRLGITMDADKSLTNGDIAQKQITGLARGLGGAWRSFRGTDARGKITDAIVGSGQRQEDYASGPSGPGYGGGRR